MGMDRGRGWHGITRGRSWPTANVTCSLVLAHAALLADTQQHANWNCAFSTAAAAPTRGPEDFMQAGIVISLGHPEAGVKWRSSIEVTIAVVQAGESRIARASNSTVPASQ